MSIWEIWQVWVDYNKLAHPVRLVETHEDYQEAVRRCASLNIPVNAQLADYDARSKVFSYVGPRPSKSYGVYKEGQVAE